MVSFYGLEGLGFKAFLMASSAKREDSCDYIPLILNTSVFEPFLSGSGGFLFLRGSDA